MVTLDDFYNRIDDVNTLIKWWVIDRKISRYGIERSQEDTRRRILQDYDPNIPTR